MPLLSLPFDILLVILRDLDIVDVVRTGMTCKDLCGVTQDRHVWIDQLEKLRRNEPAFRTATPPLASLSVQELKAFVTGWDKLRLRWNRDDRANVFAAKGLVEFPAVEDVWLLPGGKSLLAIRDSKVRLCRIELEDGQFSLSIVAKLRLGGGGMGPGWTELLTATSPSPIFLYEQGKVIYLIRVDHHNGAMSLETTFPIPIGYRFIHAHGQGRVVGFLIKRLRGFPLPQAVVIHLDHPGVSMVSEVSSDYDAGYLPRGVYIPVETLLIIYNTQYILAYEIPNFSSLSFGVNHPGVAPVWNRPGPGARLPVSYTMGETVRDSPSAQDFNLYYVSEKRFSPASPSVTTVTVPINTEGGSISKSTELPTIKKKLTEAPNHGEATAWFSCRKGLHFDVAHSNAPPLHVLVTPLNALGSEGGRKALRMTVPFEEPGEFMPEIGMDMDEATGRVVIWGWDSMAYKSKIFVADLV